MPNQVTIGTLAPDIKTLLRAHGITAPEQTLAHNGYSGARITRIEQDGEHYVLKRIRIDDDWIMRVVGDTESREAQFAASALPRQLPPSIRVPTLGAARDGDGWALLMRDIAPLLLPDEGIVPLETLDRVIGAMTDLHAAFWNADLGATGVTFVPAQRWLRLLSPESGAMLVREGRDFGLARGWRVFDEIAPPDASALRRRLHADMTLLVEVLESLPNTLLHGDFKFGNVGVDDDAVWLIDWATTMHAPVAVELAWFLAVNSSRLPCSLDETIERYRMALAGRLGARRFAEAQWEAQRGAVAVCGLLMYGWGKALDAADGRPDELAWWCDTTIAAARQFGWIS